METPEERELLAFQARAAAHQPHDPAVAGTIGKRRGRYTAAPDPAGNRAERRSAKRAKGDRHEHG